MPRKPTKRGGRRPGAGRPPIADARTERREVRLRPDEAKAHDAARGDESWSSWILAAAELAIARGSTR